ncbi:MAG: undecaprenyldiphospho-muramoylpentapeptide beta-N-acetylglucosaminyltransferase [Deltaproteobacteria bacterium]|nr:undecaprenyldiphospho-muramoylpentapeptide beta-N-acetylglucosaminyltransferase [Deltaproteobacteria bacterium]
MALKAMIAGGGTGGHLFPAIAIGEELQRARPDSELLFVGASNGMEARWFPQHGVRYELLEVRGLTGKSPLTRVRALREFLRALSRARKLLHNFDPAVVVTTGGYASAPVAVAAIMAGTPLVLMEQNTRPGLVNRMLWRLAHKICIGFADAAPGFNSSKVEVTGNPVRFSKMPQPVRQHAGPLQILVLGGSSGAHRLNLGIIKALTLLHEQRVQVSVTHQTGDADAAMVEQAYSAIYPSATVMPFIDDIAAALDSADLIVSRAGAMTVSEIALAGRAAIFVPYPFHRDRQQEHNAGVLVRLGGAVLISDDEQLGENLAQAVRQLNARRECLQEMGHRAHRIGVADAAQRIVNLCLEIADSHASIRPHQMEPAA